MSSKSRHLSVFLLILSFNVSSLLVFAQTENKEIVQSNEVETLYLQGKELLKNQNYSEALRKFHLLSFLYPQHPYLEPIQLYIIDCLIAKKHFVEAIKTIDAFIENYPDSDQLDRVKEEKRRLQTFQEEHQHALKQEEKHQALNKQTEYFKKQEKRYPEIISDEAALKRMEQQARDKKRATKKKNTKEKSTPTRSQKIYSKSGYNKKRSLTRRIHKLHPKAKYVKRGKQKSSNKLHPKSIPVKKTG